MTPKEKYDKEMAEIKAYRNEGKSSVDDFAVSDRIEEVLEILVQKELDGALKDPFARFLVNKIAEWEDEISEMKDELMKLVDTHPDLLK